MTTGWICTDAGKMGIMGDCIRGALQGPLPSESLFLTDGRDGLSELCVRGHLHCLV